MAFHAVRCLVVFPAFSAMRHAASLQIAFPMRLVLVTSVPPSSAPTTPHKYIIL